MLMIVSKAWWSKARNSQNCFQYWLTISILVLVFRSQFCESRSRQPKSSLNQWQRRPGTNSRSMDLEQNDEEEDICVKYNLNSSELIYNVGDYLLLSVHSSATGLFQAQKTIEDVLYGEQSNSRTNDAVVNKNQEFIMFNWKSGRFSEPSFNPGRLFETSTDMLEFVTTFHLCKLLKKSSSSQNRQQEAEVDNDSEEVEKYLQQYLINGRAKRASNNNNGFDQLSHQGGNSGSNNQEMSGLKLFDDEDDDEDVEDDFGSMVDNGDDDSRIDDYFANGPGDYDGIYDDKMDKIPSNIIEKQTDFIKNQHEMIDQKLEKVDSKLGTLMQALNEYNKLIKLKYLQKFSNAKLNGGGGDKASLSQYHKQKFRKFQQQFRNKKAFRMWLRQKLRKNSNNNNMKKTGLTSGTTTTTVGSLDSNIESSDQNHDSNVRVMERKFAGNSGDDDEHEENKNENVKEVFHSLLHSHFGKLMQNSDNGDGDNDSDGSQSAGNSQYDKQDNQQNNFQPPIITSSSTTTTTAATVQKESGILSDRSNEPRSKSTNQNNNKCPIIVMATFRKKLPKSPDSDMEDKICNDFERKQSLQTVLYSYTANWKDQNLDPNNNNNNNVGEGKYPDHSNGKLGSMPASTPILKPLRLSDQLFEQLLRYRGVIQLANSNDQLLRIRPDLRCSPSLPQSASTKNNDRKPILEQFYPSAFSINGMDYFRMQNGQLKMLSPGGRGQSQLISIDKFLKCPSAFPNSQPKLGHNQKIRELVEDFPELQDLSYAKDFRMNAVEKNSNNANDGKDGATSSGGVSGQFNFDTDYDSDFPNFEDIANKPNDVQRDKEMKNGGGSIGRKSKRNKNNESLNHKRTNDDDDDADRNSQIGDKEKKKKKVEDDEKTKRYNERDDKVNSRNFDSTFDNLEEKDDTGLDLTEEQLKKLHLIKAKRKKWWIYGSITAVLLLIMVLMAIYSRKTKPNENEDDDVANSRRSRRRRKSSKKSTKSSKSRRTSKSEFDSDDSGGDKSTFKSRTSKSGRSKSSKTKSRKSGPSSFSSKSKSKSKTKSRNSSKKRKSASSKSLKSKSRRKSRRAQDSDMNSFTMSPIEASLNPRNFARGGGQSMSKQAETTTTTDPQSAKQSTTVKTSFSTTPGNDQDSNDNLKINLNNCHTQPDGADANAGPAATTTPNDNVIVIDPSNLKQICTDISLANRLEQMVNESKLISRLWQMKNNLESIMVHNKDNGDNDEAYSDSGRFAESSIMNKPGLGTNGMERSLVGDKQSQATAHRQNQINTSYVKYGNNGEILSLEDDIPDEPPPATAAATNISKNLLENCKQSESIIQNSQIPPPDVASCGNPDLKSSPLPSSSWPQAKTTAATATNSNKFNVSEENAKFIKILHRLRKSLKAVYRRPSEMTAIKSL